MKRGISILILILCAFCLHAQSEFTWTMNKEGKMIALPKRAEFNLNLPKRQYNTMYLTSERQILDAQLREFIPDMREYTDERPMDMQILSSAYQAFFNTYTPMLRRVSPMALDFHEVSLVPINRNLTFVVTGQQYTWPGVGGIIWINPELAWHDERWTLSGGAFAGRFFTPFNPSPQLMGGFNAMAAYDVTDWMTVRGWGQYAFYGDKEEKNPHMLMNPFYNHTNVGGAFEFKINDGFRLGLGVNYEFNPVRGKMERQILFYPGGKIGSFRIGN